MDRMTTIYFLSEMFYTYISDTTVINYTNELIKLIFYQFDIGPEKHFHDWIQQDAIKSDEEDKVDKIDKVDKVERWTITRRTRTM